MSERIAAVARGEHKRGIGFAVCAAALITATVLFVSGLSGTSGATDRASPAQITPGTAEELPQPPVRSMRTSIA